MKPLLIFLALLLIRPAFGSLLATLLPEHSMLSLLLQEALLWGLPALLAGGFRKHAKEKALSVTAIPAGAALQCLLAALTVQWMRLVAADSVSVPLPQTVWSWALTILALAVIPAAAEEGFFRGYLQSGIRSVFGSLPAFLLSGFLFAGAHGYLSGLPAHLAVGLLCAWTFETSGCLTACILLHGAYNAMALVLTFLAVDGSWLLLVLSAVIVVEFLLLLPRRRFAPGSPDIRCRLLAGLCLAVSAAAYL